MLQETGFLTNVWKMNCETVMHSWPNFPSNFMTLFTDWRRFVPTPCSYHGRFIRPNNLADPTKLRQSVVLDYTTDTSSLIYRHHRGPCRLMSTVPPPCLSSLRHLDHCCWTVGQILGKRGTRKSSGGVATERHKPYAINADLWWALKGKRGHHLSGCVTRE